MLDIADILKERIEKFKENPQLALKVKGQQYQKDWNFAVKCFQERINKDRKKAKQKDLPFIAVRMKLAALREVDDLRAFYKQCLDYSYTKDKQGRRNTFSKAFMGATKIR